MASTTETYLSAQRILENAGVRILGVVLKRMSAPQDGYYGPCKNSRYSADDWNALVSQRSCPLCFFSEHSVP